MQPDLPDPDPLLLWRAAMDLDVVNIAAADVAADTMMISSGSILLLCCCNSGDGFCC